jgi:uncharacterized protein (DUF302 family)
MNENVGVAKHIPLYTGLKGDFSQMRKWLITSTSLLFFVPSVGVAQGLISIESAGGSVGEVADRFSVVLKEKGLKLFIRVNHAEGGKGVNLELGPTELMIFGNPKVGTPLMQCNRTAGIDLPQKALIWEDDKGQVWITYNDPQYLAKRHDITEACAETLAKVGKALSGVASAAADSTTLPPATKPEIGLRHMPAVNMTEVPDFSRNVLKLPTVTVDKSMTFNNVELAQNVATGLFAISQFSDYHIDTTRTQLNGGQVNPPLSSQGSGLGILNVDLVTGEIAGTLLIAGLLDVTAAHIHQGAVGEDGSVVIPLAGDNAVRTVPKDTILEPAQLTTYVDGNLYFNVHTKENPKGELRGQIIPFANQEFISVSDISGAQVVPNEVETSANGVGVLQVNLNNGDLSGYIALSELPDVTAAHIHQGARGENGGVVVPLEPNDDKTIFSVPEGTVLTPSQLVNLLKEELYFNAHTAEHPAGVIRGQIERVVD